MSCLPKSPEAPRLSYFNTIIWEEVRSRSQLLFGLEEDWDIRDFLIEEGGLSPSTAQDIITDSQETLTPQEVRALAGLLAFPKALLQAVIDRRPGGELLGIVEGLDVFEGYERKWAKELLWHQTPRQEEAITACLRIAWGLECLDAASPYEDILALACETLRWTVVGAPGGGRR
jgi:hypothetical protein